MWSHLRRTTVGMLSLAFSAMGIALLAPSTGHAAPTNVVISQVYGGGGNAGSTYTNDFIELYNPTANAIDMTGWSVQYTFSTGAAWQVTNISGVLASGQYYLIQEAQGAGGTTPLPTPNVPGTIAMSATAGKVALVASQVALSVSCPVAIDLVGYGTAANCFEGSGPTPAPSNANAVLRKMLGCQDNNDNANDFVAGIPNPRTTATPLSFCGAPTPPSGVGQANPGILAPGYLTSLTFQVTAGTQPPTTNHTVSVDLSQIGGSLTQTFFDDGTNGDQFLGDNIFTYQATVAPATAPGVKSLAVTIGDAESRPGTGNISVTIKIPDNPAPQPLPYTETFSALPWNTTTYPTGWVGWDISPTSTAFVNDGPIVDQSMLALGDATKNSISTYNYDQKLGFLCSSHILALATAINTTGRSGIFVRYDLGTLRNPYDGSGNTRISEAALQYRVGTSGTWTTAPGTLYYNGTINQTGTTTTPQNQQTFSVTLPATCDNQPVVQLRWCSHDFSGAGIGGRPSFEVDNFFATYSNIITASAGPGGTIFPSGSVPVVNGSDQNFTITPDGTHAIQQVLVDGNPIGPTASYTFLGVTGPRTISASFAPITEVTPVSPSTCVTPAACVTVPFDIVRNDPSPAPMLGYHVEFHITSNVALCNGLASITEGTYMNASHSTSFQKLDDGGGHYTVDGVTLNNPCGATGASGNLFNIKLKNVSTGPYSVVIDNLIVRDCANHDLPSTIGGPATGNSDNAPVSVDPIPDPTVAEQSMLTVNPNAVLTSCAATPLSWTATGLPAGASISPSSGQVTWTPDCSAFENGPNYGPVTVKATDTNGNFGTASFTIHVTNTPATVTVHVSSPSPSDELTPITVTPSAILSPCAFPPVTWSITPALPSGATFDPSNGKVQWTPSCGQAGSYGPFTLTATASSGQQGMGNFSLTVNHKAGTVTVSVSSPPASDESTPITVTPSAMLTSCAAGPLTWSITPALPAGASFDPSTGVTTWTPSCGQAGAYGPFTLKATAATSEFGTGNFSLTVNHKVGTVTVHVTNQTVAEGATLAYTPGVALGSCAAAPVTWSATGAPAGSTFDPSTGKLTWTPDCAAFENGPDYGPVQLTATAATSEIGNGSYMIHVTNTPIAIAQVTNLVAAQLLTGNDADGTTKIKVTYTVPSGATSVVVYRAAYGHYPLYDDGGGAVPSVPSYPPGAPWTPVTTVTASGQFDEPSPRDFWYYVAFAKNDCGDVSPVSAMTSGTLNYHLGDVTNGTTPGQGDNLVQIEDVSLLGAHYGASGAALAGFQYLDIGPTTNNFVSGRPLTDGKASFEDLVLLAINYGEVSGPSSAKRVATDATDVLSMSFTTPAADRVMVHVILHGSGALQAVSTALKWNADVLEPIGYAAGSMLTAQHGIALSADPGTVDAAILGVHATGLTGNGELATLTFRIKSAGSYGLALKSAIGRSAANAPVPVSLDNTTAAEKVTPTVTQFAPPSPNPFPSRTALSFSLARSGPVSLEIYSVDGRRVRSLMSGVREAGAYRETWDGRNDTGATMNAGIYYARLITTQGMFTRKLIRLN